MNQQTKQAQLELLALWCDWYVREHPRNHGTYKGGIQIGDVATTLTEIDREVRDGIVFYSSGWGWRLRQQWREKLEERRQELQVEQKVQDVEESMRMAGQILEGMVALATKESTTCASCGQTVERMEQIGRCVYLRPCGCRFWQGRVPEAWRT